MSEPIPAEIWIGGKIPQRLVPKLCDAITAEGVSLDWADACFIPETPEELLSACREQRGVWLLCLCDDQARYGQFKVLESFLEDHKISFTRRSDARYEFDSELIEYRPAVGLVCYPTNNSGEPFVTLSTLADIAAAVDRAVVVAKGKPAAVLLKRLRSVQKLVKKSMPIIVPPLEQFEIVAARNKKESVCG